MPTMPLSRWAHHPRSIRGVTLTVPRDALAMMQCCAGCERRGAGIRPTFSCRTLPRARGPDASPEGRSASLVVFWYGPNNYGQIACRASGLPGESKEWAARSPGTCRAEFSRSVCRVYGRRRGGRGGRGFARAADERHQQQSRHQHRGADQAGQSVRVRYGFSRVCHASLSATAGDPARRFAIHHGSRALPRSNIAAVGPITGDAGPSVLTTRPCGGQGRAELRNKETAALTHIR